MSKKRITLISRALLLLETYILYRGWKVTVFVSCQSMSSVSFIDHSFLSLLSLMYPGDALSKCDPAAVWPTTTTTTTTEAVLSAAPPRLVSGAQLGAETPGHLGWALQALAGGRHPGPDPAPDTGHHPGQMTDADVKIKVIEDWDALNRFKPHEQILALTRLLL